MPMPGSPRPKLIYVAQAPGGVSQSHFTARWRQHAALGMRQARWRNVATYLHCDPLALELQCDPALATAGIAVVQYLSEANRLAHIADESARQTMKADELLTFAQPVANTALLLKERIIKASGIEGYRLFVFWQASGPDFAACWLAHGQDRSTDILRDETITFAAQNVPALTPDLRQGGLDCDGIDEFASTDLLALRALALGWQARSAVPGRAQFVLTRTVVLHDLPSSL